MKTSRQHSSLLQIISMWHGNRIKGNIAEEKPDPKVTPTSG